MQFENQNLKSVGVKHRHRGNLKVFTDLCGGGPFRPWGSAQIFDNNDKKDMFESDDGEEQY